MTYLSDRKRNRKQYRYYIAVFVVLAGMTYFWPHIRTSIYPHLESFIISTGTSKNAIIRTPSTIYTYFQSRRELILRASTLSLTVERLENELAEKNALLKEKELIETDGMKVGETTIAMYPLIRDLTTIYSSLILSKGFKDGIVTQDLVFIHGRKPVCIIVEVYDRTSLCKLMTSSGEVTEGVTASSTLNISLKGDGGGTFVGDVPRDTVIAQGESIFLKSDPSMILGTVSNVIRDDQAVAWRVYVRGAYNPVTSSVFYVQK